MASKKTEKAKTDLAWKATSALTLLASGFIAEKVVALGWKAVTGRPAPKDEDKLLDYQLGEVIAFAVISGAIMTLTRELTLRGAASWYGGKDHNPLSKVLPEPEQLTA